MKLAVAMHDGTMHEASHTRELIYTQPFPALLRGVLALIGLLIIFFVPWNFGHLLWPPNLLTLFFGAIVLGALSVGYSFLAGGLNGPQTVFRVSAGKMVIEETTPFSSRRYDLTLADVKSTGIETRHWDNTPDTHAVRLETMDGTVFHLPERMSRKGAEDMRREILDLLSAPAPGRA